MQKIFIKALKWTIVLTFILHFITETFYCITDYYGVYFDIVIFLSGCSIISACFLYIACCVFKLSNIYKILVVTILLNVVVPYVENTLLITVLSDFGTWIVFYTINIIAIILVVINLLKESNHSRNSRNKNLSDKQYQSIRKIFLLLLKYTPSLVVASYLLMNLLILFYDIYVNTLFNIVFSLTFLTNTLFLIGSYVFCFCSWHKVILYINYFNFTLSLLDALFGIPIDYYNMMIYINLVNIVGVFIALYLHLRDKARDKAKHKMAKERFCKCDCE